LLPQPRAHLRVHHFPFTTDAVRMSRLGIKRQLRRPVDRLEWTDAGWRWTEKGTGHVWDPELRLPSSSYYRYRPGDYIAVAEACYVVPLAEEAFVPGEMYQLRHPVTKQLIRLIYQADLKDGESQPSSAVAFGGNPPYWTVREVYRIVENRVERLQEITLEDVALEGFGSMRFYFTDYWDSIYGVTRDADKSAWQWEHNPYVHVLTYTNVHGEERYKAFSEMMRRWKEGRDKDEREAERLRRLDRLTPARGDK